MTTDPTTSTGARMLSEGAHELRNHVATIRSVVRLVDDAEVADALDEASRAVLVAVERAIVLARVELGNAPERVQLELGTLVQLAERRARREGAVIDHEAGGDGGDVPVDVPGPWAERLVADLLHHVAGAPALAATGDAGVIEVPLLDRVPAPLDDALVSIAAACGGELAWEDGFAVLRLPRARSLSAE